MEEKRVENKIIISWFNINLVDEKDKKMFNEIEEILERNGYIYSENLDYENISKIYIKESKVK